MCTNTYVYMYIHVRVHTHVKICMCVCLRVCMCAYVYMWMWTYMSMNMCMCMCVHVCMHVFVYVCRCVCVVCVCVCEYVGVCVCLMYMYVVISTPTRQRLCRRQTYPAGNSPPLQRANGCIIAVRGTPNHCDQTLHRCGTEPTKWPTTCGKCNATHTTRFACSAKSLAKAATRPAPWCGKCQTTVFWP